MVDMMSLNEDIRSDELEEERFVVPAESPERPYADVVCPIIVVIVTPF